MSIFQVACLLKKFQRSCEFLHQTFRKLLKSATLVTTKGLLESPLPPKKHLRICPHTSTTVVAVSICVMRLAEGILGLLFLSVLCMCTFIIARHPFHPGYRSIPQVLSTTSSRSRGSYFINILSWRNIIIAQSGCVHAGAEFLIKQSSD